MVTSLDETLDRGRLDWRIQRLRIENELFVLQWEVEVDLPEELVEHQGLHQSCNE